MLACKLIHKCRKDECSVGVTLDAKICTQGINMNRVQFLMIDLIQDFLYSQELGKELYYNFHVSLARNDLVKSTRG